MTEKRNVLYVPIPQAAGTARLYSNEIDGQDIVPVPGTGFTLLKKLAPGLWIVRNISAAGNAVELALSRRSEPLRQDPASGIIIEPRVLLADPIFDVLTTSPGRATCLEIDVSDVQCDLWGRIAIGEVKSFLKITKIARRTEGDQGYDLGSTHPT